MSLPPINQNSTFTPFSFDMQPSQPQVQAQPTQPVQASQPDEFVKKGIPAKKILTGAGAVALVLGAGALIFNAIKKGKVKDVGEAAKDVAGDAVNKLLKDIKFEKGVASLQDGSKFTGVIEDALKSGNKITMEYKDGNIVKSVTDKFEKNYLYNKNGLLDEVVTKLPDSSKTSSYVKIYSAEDALAKGFKMEKVENPNLGDYPNIIKRNGEDFKGKIHGIVNVDGSDRTIISSWGDSLSGKGELNGYSIVDKTTKKPVASFSPYKMRRNEHEYYENGIKKYTGHVDGTIAEFKEDGSKISFFEKDDLFSIKRSDGSSLKRNTYPDRGVYKEFSTKDEGTRFISDCYGNKLYNGKELVSEGVPFDKLLGPEGDKVRETVDSLKPLWDEIGKIEKNPLTADFTRINSAIQEKSAEAEKIFGEFIKTMS